MPCTLNLIFLRNFFISNGFPSNLISSVIRNFLNKRRDPQNFTVSHNDNPVRYYVFPYFSPQSDKLKNELLTLLNKYVTDFSFKIILVNNFKIDSFFNYKTDSLCALARLLFINLIAPYVKQCTLTQRHVHFVLGQQSTKGSRVELDVD